MAMNLLRQIAGSRLPVPFYRQEDIDGVRVLRAAGLVVALVRSASEANGTLAEAQVLAITQKGREELAKVGYPEQHAPRWRFRMPPIKTVAFTPRTGKPSPPREPTRPH